MKNENFGELATHRTQLENPVKAASSESTKIEQARAFAEVAMQVDLAKKYPRNMDDVFRRIEETFERSPGLLLKTKWKFPRGGKSLTGYTIQFARAIAECVGNIKYSFRELSRENKQSEMMVYAWDMETNTIQDRTIIIPHTRDIQGGGTKILTHERDIYENNANNASRRLRECILGVLPAAARRKGEEVVESLLANAFPEEKRQQYIDAAIAEFLKMGVKKELLITERGNRPPETWTRNDIVALKAYAEEIKRGDATIEDIFKTSNSNPKKKPASPNFETRPEKTQQKKEEPAAPKEEEKKKAPAAKTGNKDKLGGHVEALRAFVNDHNDTVSTVCQLPHITIVTWDEIENAFDTQNEIKAQNIIKMIESTERM